MAKKTSSIHIENRLWDYIAQYQKENGIDSRNTAIEWILVEHRGNCSVPTAKNEDNSNKDKAKENKLESRESDSMLAQMEQEMPD